jgi:pimeloyl-ACP methyl ester carboxylesterase
MATKPSIVLVGGSFATPAVYDLVVSRLKDSGFDVEVPQLPSIGRREGEPPTLADDVAHVHSVLEHKADEGKDVLIIGHSYGGIPTTEAIQGLSKADREKQGKEGGVVRILYTTAVLPELGQTAAEFFGGGFADFVVIDVSKLWRITY